MNDIKILVCCHKPSKIHYGNIYLPIQVGKARNNIDLGIQTDDLVNGCNCDNISDLNHLYCEMTAMYWAWKNIRKIYPDIKYVGLCHYRRYFSLEKHNILDKLKIFVHKGICATEVLAGVHNSTVVIDPVHHIRVSENNRFQNSDDKLTDLIRLYDLISTKPVYIINGTVESYFSTIGREYVQLLKNIVKEKYPVYYNSLLKVLASSKLNAANMIILRIELFDEYCHFVFDVLRRHIESVKELGICSDPTNESIYSRIPGYLAEILTCAYVISKKESYRIRYVDKFFVDE